MKVLIILFCWFLFFPVTGDSPLSLPQEGKGANYFKRYCLSVKLEESAEKAMQFRKVFSGAKWKKVKETLFQLGGISIQIYSLENEQLMIIETNMEFQFATAMEKLAKSKAYEKWQRAANPFDLGIGNDNATEGWQLLERIYKLEQKRSFDPENGIIKEQLNSHKRFCMTLPLVNEPENIKEYKQIHAMGNAWHQIVENMKNIGIKDMEIYLRGNQAFLIMDTKSDFDYDKDLEKWGKMPREKEWQNYVGKFQQVDPESSTKMKWRLMKRL